MNLKNLFFTILILNFSFTEELSELLENQPTVTVHAEDTYLPTILSMLAQQSGFNIVTGPNVQTQEKLTIHLDEVPTSQAINLIIRASGLSYEIIGNSILVIGKVDNVVNTVEIFPSRVLVNETDSYYTFVKLLDSEEGRITGKDIKLEFAHSAGTIATNETTGTTNEMVLARSDLFNGNNTRENHSLYTQLDKKWNRLNVSLGARYEYFSINSETDHVVDKDTINHLEEGKPVFRTGVNYQLAEQWQKHQ